tara:strand:- start:264 stop:650 length:387 start_codon:yes stop_codon:yes gene_type:complete
MPIKIEIYDHENKIYNVRISDFTDEELDNFIISYKILLNSDNNFKMIFSSLELENISFRQVVKLGVFLESFRPVHRKNLDKFCIIIRNNKIIKILNGLFILIPPVRPYLLVQTFDEGLNYIKSDIIVI